MTSLDSDQQRKQVIAEVEEARQKMQVALAAIASATGLARCYVGDTGDETCLVDSARVRPGDAASQLRIVADEIKVLRAALATLIKGGTNA